jgi:hypothetical protein
VIGSGAQEMNDILPTGACNLANGWVLSQLPRGRKHPLLCLVPALQASWAAAHLLYDVLDDQRRVFEDLASVDELQIRADAWQFQTCSTNLPRQSARRSWACPHRLLIGAWIPVIFSCYASLYVC